MTDRWTGGEDSVTVSWPLAVEDVLHVGQLHKRWEFRFNRALALVVGGGAFLTQILGADFTVWLPGYVIAGALILFEFIWTPRSIRKRLGPLVGETNPVRLDERGIHSDLDDMHDWAEWSAVTGLLENENTLIISRGKLIIAYVPKRAFASPSELDAFRQYLDRHRPKER